MDHLEMVEKLREKANVSYEEARAALEAADWDMLDAVVLLEKQGKVDKKTARHSTRQENTSEDRQTDDIPKQQYHSTGFGEVLGRFFRWVGRVIHKGNINSLEIEKNGEKIASIPVTAVVLLLIFCFWIIIPLLIVALFFGYRISFSGPNLGREDVNNVMDKASKVADNIKDEFKDAHNNRDYHNK